LNIELPNSPVFFLDKNHGLLIREILRGVGLVVVAHKEMQWHPEMKDVQIINECASRNFVIISGDKAMSRVPEERQAIVSGRCKVFMFNDSDKTRTEDWIAALLVGRERILEIVTKTKGPLFVTIKPCRTTGHIGRVDFVEKAGGGWLLEDEKPEPVAVPPIEHLPGNLRPHKEQQQVINWDLLVTVEPSSEQ
jgi:hypothetical protein